MQSLMKGKDFPKHSRYIYIYMKVDKGVVKIKFCYPMFACEENGKAPCKILQSLPFKKGFLEKYFCSFENILLGYSRSLFRNESPGGQCQILCFECQCPKIMVLSKALKAKLSSIPKSRKSVDAQPRTENRQAFVWPSVVVTLPHTRGPVEVPSQMIVRLVVHVELRVLSLSLSLSLCWGR